jgi:hypothetical protein
LNRIKGHKDLLIANEVLIALINGVFGGKLAPESFVLSQSYYFGSVNGNPDHQAVVVDGQFLDQMADQIYRLSVYQDGSRVRDGSPQQRARRDYVDGREFAFDDNPYSRFGKDLLRLNEAEIEFALNQISPDCPYYPTEEDPNGPYWMKIGAALASALDYDDGYTMFDRWSKKETAWVARDAAGWRDDRQRWRLCRPDMVH